MTLRRIAVFAGALMLSAPGAHAAGPVCGDPCEVRVSTAGYVSPFNEVANGATVVWSATSASHPTSDSTGLNRCFLVSIGAETEPGPVRFDVSGGALFATSYPGTADASTSECTAAVVLPTGRFLLPFQCLIHPWMHGALLIDP